MTREHVMRVPYVGVFFFLRLNLGFDDAILTAAVTFQLRTVKKCLFGTVRFRTKSSEVTCALIFRIFK